MKLLVSFDCPKVKERIKMKRFKCICGIRRCANCLVLEELLTFVTGEHGKDYWKLDCTELFSHNGVTISRIK